MTNKSKDFILNFNFYFHQIQPLYFLSLTLLEILSYYEIKNFNRNSFIFFT